MSHRTPALVVLLVFGVAAPAQAQLHRYVGAHPLDHAGHWHREEAEHTHAGLAIGDAPFAEADGVRHFLADPVAWGWDGDVFLYRGVHPLPGDVRAYCGIQEPHAHAFAPEGSYRRDRGEIYAYVGGLRGGYAMLEPQEMGPREPIAAPAAVAAPVFPFWFAGCLHQITGAPGAYTASALFGCHPSAPFRGAWLGGGRAYDPGPPRSAPPAAAPVTPRRRGPAFTTRPDRGRPRAGGSQRR